MSRVNVPPPQGVLREGWSAMMGDYAIAGGWLLRGKALVVGDAAGGVQVFKSTSGQTLWEQHETHKGGMLAIAVHPKGHTFATAGQDGRVQVWDAKHGQIKQTIEVGKGWVEHIAWAPNGQWLAASCSRKVRVFDKKGHKVSESEDHPSTVSALAWSNAGELATACYGRVTFFKVPAWDIRQKLEWKGSLVSMVLSPNGDIVACGSQDNSVHFWRRSTEQDSMMSGYQGKPSALAFDSTGTLLATNGGDAVTVWSFQGNGPEGTQPGILEFHAQSVATLAFARRGMLLASGGRDGGVVVWLLQKNGEGAPVGAAVLKDVIAKLYWRPDGRALAALDGQGGVTLWQIDS